METKNLCDLSLEKRKRVASMARQLHPGRIPVVLKLPKQSTLHYHSFFRYSATPPPQHWIPTKYLVAEEITVGAFCAKLKIEWDNKSGSHSAALFLFTENSNTCLMVSETMGKVYAQNQNEDEFLYLHLCEEDTFGNVFR